MAIRDLGWNHLQGVILNMGKEDASNLYTKALLILKMLI